MKDRWKWPVFNLEPLGSSGTVLVTLIAGSSSIWKLLPFILKSVSFLARKPVLGIEGSFNLSSPRAS
eukprot:CAMPEP_0184502502 /NCGR_PEP_ID=MMETSP0113_2-20130426/50517_1 /TAXON_ID=91329 /ORGANISM="Norrisiella sphaerica, Strain BC52" /LENGTH=66 /DNA_ID=CAMNT_0026891707 /DNA_START=66 /DNA_END=263 /DNA_ORIENTATION=-